VDSSGGGGPLGAIPVFESARDVVEAVKNGIASEEEQRKPESS